ncbi:hypothetical protein QBC34DRAFT_147976 [Podospora aff. communis PSN243]|uniref:NACHT domain-containing protein n=1 Tax=Podospora aff. communis PSN243 TaxID=3040156 RepID=A0AAV9GHG0_9PEZI|nr:hypothetical protein QBC34DRAFT_147976 [Podospora aff. communis PSN243]
MEAVQALGLACNVMQIITFTCETANAAKKLFRDGLDDPRLLPLAEGSVELYRTLEKDLSRFQPLSEDEVRLARIARDCVDAGTILRTEVANLTLSKTQGRLLRSVRAALKAKASEGKLEKVRRSMEAHQKVLELGLLMRICNTEKVLQLQQDEGFGRLDQELQSFIRAHSKGQERLEGLIRRQTDSFKQATRAETQRSELSIVAQLSIQSSKTRDDVTQLFLEANHKEKRQGFLKSLEYDGMNDRWLSVNDTHHGTFRWILQGIRPWLDDAEGLVSLQRTASHFHPDCAHVAGFPHMAWRCFPCWLDSPSEKIYWIQGKPGSGKSTLMKFLVREIGVLSSASQGSIATDRTVLFHFIWAGGGTLQKSICGILRSLLQQLLSQHAELLDAVIEDSPQLASNHRHGRLTKGELESLFGTCISRYGKPVLIFIDGLDEMVHSERNLTDTHDNLLQLLHKLASIDKVKLCLSSRLEPEFQRGLGEFPTLRLQDLTREDMRLFAQDHLRRFTPPGALHDGEYADLVDIVCEKADGVFQWLALVVQSLARGMRNGDTLPELQLRLQTIPDDINGLYQMMWSRTHEDHGIYQEEAARCFNMMLDWSAFAAEGSAVEVFHLLMASKPSKAECILQDATAISPDAIQGECNAYSRRIAIRTAGLLEISPNGRRVDFIHRTAIEFLQNTPEGRKILSYDHTPSEDRVLSLVSAYLADVHLQVLGLRTNEGYSDITQSAAMNSVYNLWDRGAITDSAGYGLMMACKRFDETGLWRHTPLGQDPAVAIHAALDFYGLAASYGFPNVIARLVGDSPLSVSARRYLFVAACKEPTKMDRVDYQGKGRVVAEILGHDKVRDLEDQQLGLPILFFAALNIYGGEKRWPTVPGLPTLPQLLDQYLAGPFSLEERITLTLKFEDDDLWIPNPHGIGAIETAYSRMSSKWVTLETSLLSMARLCLEALVGSDEAIPIEEREAARQALDSLNALSLEQHMRVLAFGFLTSGTASTATRPYVSNKDGMALAPATSADAEGALDLLRGLRLDYHTYNLNGEGEAETRYYRIPGLLDRLRDITPDARVLEEDELEKFKDLTLRKAMLDLMTNPPEPFAK